MVHGRSRPTVTAPPVVRSPTSEPSVDPRGAAAVVAISRHAADAIVRRAGLPADKVSVASCGADRPPLVERRAEDGVRRLAIAGAVAHYKHLDVVVEAMGLLGEGNELVLAGEEWPDTAGELGPVARRLGIESRIWRAGQIADDALAALYADAHATISLSRCESFGLPVIEAMRAGAPTVVADEAWSRELAGDAALFADSDDPAAVAAAVSRLDDPGILQDRSRAAAARAAVFTWRGPAAGIARAAAALARRRPA